jgi:xylulokinase
VPDSTDLIIAHDVGTSGVKTVLTDARGRIQAKHMEPYPTHFPRPGWAEQDAEDWWRGVCLGTRAVWSEGHPSGSLACVTFSTQMMGLVPLDARGAVLHRPIIWLDGRASAEATVIMRRFGGTRLFTQLAGATLSGKDMMPKLRWLRFHEPDIWKEMACFVDVGGYLLRRCTGRTAMEWTGASAFGFDLKSKRWMSGVMRMAGIASDKLPPLVRPIDVVGGASDAAAADLGVARGTPIVAGMGDVPAAAIGSGAVGDGDGHLYLGTSGWVGLITAGHPTGRHGVAVIQSGDPERNLMTAEMDSGGACIDWVADELYRGWDRELARRDVYAEIDRDAEASPPGSGSLLFTPWMCGERALNDPFLRAAFLNLGPEHHRESLARAALEGVAFNFRWILEQLEQDFHLAPRTLRVVGGGARSTVWMQIIADVTQRRLEVVDDPQDAGAVGAALSAGVALGIHPSFSSLRELVQVTASFDPHPEATPAYDFLFHRFQEAYRHLRGLYRAMNGGSAPPSP